MGKLHVKGWGRKTNYLNGKVACQGLGESHKQSGKMDPRISHEIDPRNTHKIDPRNIHSTLLMMPDSTLLNLMF